jgi:uncharacterized protein
MARITHFDMSGNDPQKLIKFYGKIFSWKFDQWGGSESGYWLITTGPKEKPGIDGGLGKREKDNYIVNTIEVENLDDTLRQISQNGGTLLDKKSPIPGVGWYASFKDPEDNMFGLMQPDTNAK